MSQLGLDPQWMQKGKIVTGVEVGGVMQLDIYSGGCI